MLFPKQVIDFLTKVTKRLWACFDSFNDDALHVINVTDVFQKYIDYKVEDIEEFAVIYTYEIHDAMGKLDHRESKEKMYADVYGLMLHLKEKGKLEL